ncbi:hypothetical protein ABIA23_003094 [Sinorhizobium fredii]
MVLGGDAAGVERPQAAAYHGPTYGEREKTMADVVAFKKEEPNGLLLRVRRTARSCG